MCGICGIVRFDRSSTVDPALLVRMTSTLAHRGPDADGYFLEGNVGLGHRRLSIIDLSGGNQPIFNEDKSVVVIFNGEIYNYAEITKDLQARGHRFATHSDTETIVHAYEEYGEKCVERFRGMFGIALWNRNTKELFVARDRLGVKPLYYYCGDSFFAFASELKAILEIPEVPRELDPEALNLYLSLRYVPGPRTMFRNILKLQPGHVLKLRTGRPEISQYWDLPVDDATDPRSLDDPVEEFNHLLEESVRLRLVAEVPLGVFLSGGLDSSAILAAMSNISNRKQIKTFSVGYAPTDAGEERSNEFDYARLAASHFGAEHYEYRVTAREFRDAIPSLVWHLDEPLADPSCIPLYFIAQEARKQITVVLSGEGADETLAGYGIYKRMLQIETIQRTLGPKQSQLVSSLGRALPFARVSHYLQMIAQPLEDRYRGVSRAFRPAVMRRLLGKDGVQASEEGLSALAQHWNKVDGRTTLSRMLYLDTKVWLPDDILLKADKMSMAHSLELRVPFLDHKLVEFATRLPAKFKLSGRWGKVLLRKAMSGQLPDAIIRRPKKGFPVPIEQWLRGPLRNYARDTLLASDSACRRYFDPLVIEGLLSEHASGSVPRHEEIWSLVVFECWSQMFMRKSQEIQAERLPEVIGVA